MNFERALWYLVGMGFGAALVAAVIAIVAEASR